METLKRLRIVWTVLCCLLLAALAVAAYGGTPVPLVVAVGAGVLIGAVGPYSGNAFVTTACMWVGGTAMLSLLLKGQHVGEFVLWSFGLLAVVVLAGWVLKPLLTSKQSAE
jgi:hypothetical protein